MPFTKLVLVFVVLVGGRCCSKMIIIPTDTDVLAQFENSAIQLITTCYTNYDKTIVILGDVTGNFIKKLSLHQFSLVLLDIKKTVEHNVYYTADQLKIKWKERIINRKHKVHIVVTMVTEHQVFTKLLWTFRNSPYSNREVYFLILGASPKNIDAACNRLNLLQLLYDTNHEGFLNANLMCCDRATGIVLFSLNHFTNWAPEPWWLEKFIKRHNKENDLSYFARNYSQNNEMCNNLYFDKTHDLGGSTIETISQCHPGLDCLENLEGSGIKNFRKLATKKGSYFIGRFISYVNATRKYVWFATVTKEKLPIHIKGIVNDPYLLDGSMAYRTHTPVHGETCMSLISQFRGNKSQLHKIVSVIDSYSWVGNCIVCIMTLIIFKYLLRQQLIMGLMNICRLICNSGITAEPSDVPARIYLGSLLFFVITMQGIFTGNLAALLTHDIPVRQVNTIKDLADLGYTVYSPRGYLKYFENPAFKDRLIVPYYSENCINNVTGDPLAACVVWSDIYRDEAMDFDLYVSSNCIINRHDVTMIPWQWHLEEKLKTFVGIAIGGNFLVEFDMLVYDAILSERNSEEILVEPVIMTFGNLRFAFFIYGIGLGCAFITFIAEIMIYRYHHRVRTTRVIVLN